MQIAPPGALHRSNLPSLQIAPSMLSNVGIFRRLPAVGIMDVGRAPPQTVCLHRSLALKRIAYTALPAPCAPPGLFRARKITRQTCTAAPRAPSPLQHGAAHPRREPPPNAQQPACPQASAPTDATSLQNAFRDALTASPTVYAMHVTHQADAATCTLGVRAALAIAGASWHASDSGCRC